jgi:transposase InsO family protein
MRWVMTIKDHATGLMHLCALPRKQPKLVAYRLQELFGLLGCPRIFHTDNGKEFTAAAVLQFLRSLNPGILSVTGHSRHPCDQGSVENMNKMVNRILGSVLAKRHLSGENPNWTVVLGHGRGKNDASAYEAVFDQKFHHQYS